MDVRCPDDLAPFGGLIRDVLPELRGRGRKGRIARRLDAGFYRRVRESGIDRTAEPLDDLSRRAFRYAETLPAGRFVTRHGLAQGGHRGQALDACRRGDAEPAQPAGLDVLDRGRERVEH